MDALRASAREPIITRMDGSNAGARLVIVCGLPGSGKTTLAKSLEKKLGAVRLAPDEWMEALAISLYDVDGRARIETLQWTLGQDLLRLGMVVIVEWGTWFRSERDTLRQAARTLGAAVELRYLTAPADVLVKRIELRAREDPPLKADHVARWFEIFQPPTIEEMALFDEPLED
jgi:predicted kinase